MKVLVLASDAGGAAASEDDALESNAAIAAIAAVCRARGHDVVVEAAATDDRALNAAALLGPHAPAIVVAHGAVAVRRVRALAGGHTPLVLAVAGGPVGPDEAQALLDAGADDVLAARTSPREIGLRVAVLERRALDEDRALSEPLRALPDLIVRVSSAGVFLSIRVGPDYVPRLLDPSRVGQTIEEVFTARDATVLRRALDEVVRERRPVLLEGAFELRGLSRWFETRFFPGRADDAIVLSRDVTDRKVAEGRLRESEMRAKAVFDSEMLGMFEWTTSGSIIGANDALLAMIGYTRAELEAGEVSWSKMTPPEYWGLEQRAGKEIMARGVCTPFEKEYVRKDGSRVPIIIGGVALDELRTHGLSFVIDISDRKRVERQLRESNERYEIVARATSDAVWDWDIKSGVIGWNQTFHTLFGYTTDEVEAGIAWWADKLHPDDRERVNKSLDEWVVGTDLTWSADYRFLTRDARYAHVTDRGYMIRDPGGRGVRAIGAMVDVTERTEMQRRLLLADRLASLGTLAAGVAHEINNPLTHVIGNVDVAVRRLAEPGADRRGALEALDDARIGADRVRNIVRDLRTFARVDEAKRDVIDVHAPLDWAARIAGHAVHARARLVMTSETVPPILGDESRLGQVFVNLLVNAAQAIPEGNPAGNEVRVSTSLQAGRDGDVVVVTVADTGTGIAADVRGRIFDPFFTTKDVGVGTGLGLSICHGIVTSLGGTIEVESELGRGTTFRVLLPVAEARAPAAEHAREPAALGRRGQVLIVDDDALTRALLERTLGIEHEVTALPTAEQALALVQGGARFDVVFSDLMMPEMTGMDFHAALIQLAPEQAARMVFLTAGAVSASAQHFLHSVENAWLEKPFDLDELLEITRRRLR